MTVVGDEFRARWASRRHVGTWAPTQTIQVRKGEFQRGYSRWQGNPVDAKIPGESKETPWQSTWVPLTAWSTLPTVVECSMEQGFDSNGIATATITLENVLLRETSNLGVLYHYIDRGALAPWRGYNAPGQPWWQVAPNEWYGVLMRNSQVRIWQGYGVDVAVSPFVGLIDDVDTASQPDRIVLTCRDFGKVLTEERMFGWNIGPKLRPPVIFTAAGKLTGVGEAAGHGAEASTERDGHPARFVTDRDVKTIWISHDHTTAANTEYVQIRLPKGRYESIAIHPNYPGMEVFVGVYARDNLLGGEPCQIDDFDIPNGWIRLPDDEGGGVVPGSPHGGWPYIKRWPAMSDAGKSYRLDHKLELGDDSVMRVGFRNLRHIGNGVHRCGCARFKAIRRKSERSIVLRLVGKDADASTSRDGHPSKNVLDDDTQTTWISHDHTTAGNTEWVEIHVGQGRYESFQIYTEYPGMDMYVGVYARNRRRKKTKGEGYVETPSQLNDQNIGEGFVDLGLGDVPGTHGGWPYVGFYNDIGPHSKHKPEKFYLTNGHDKFELGDDSVIRIGFRELHYIGNSGGQPVHRAQVGKLKAYTRTGVKQPEQVETVKKIEVDDPSDIVRVILRWAGFKEWVVENTGAKLRGDWIFDQKTFYRDVIQKVEDATGFVFYISPPSENDASIGIPVFRQAATLRLDEPTLTVRDSDLLSAVQVKMTEEPLAYIIRVRGVEDKKGLTIGGGSVRRLMSVYRPPWWGSMGRILKHLVHEDKRLSDQKSVEIFARLIAMQEALAAATATIEIPGMPEFEPDGQLALWDLGSGFKTRLYITAITSSFSSGSDAAWKTTVSGALMDTPDMVAVRNDLFALAPPGQGLVLSDMLEVE